MVLQNLTDKFLQSASSQIHQSHVLYGNWIVRHCWYIHAHQKQATVKANGKLTVRINVYRDLLPVVHWFCSYRVVLKSVPLCNPTVLRSSYISVNWSLVDSQRGLEAAYKSKCLLNCIRIFGNITSTFHCPVITLSPQECFPLKEKTFSKILTTYCVYYSIIVRLHWILGGNTFDFTIYKSTYTLRRFVNGYNYHHYVFMHKRLQCIQ